MVRAAAFGSRTLLCSCVRLLLPRKSPHCHACCAQSRDVSGALPGSDEEEDDAVDLASVVHVSALGRGALNAGAPDGADEEEDDALVAEKIRLLQEENQRLRAAAAAKAARTETSGAAANDDAGASAAAAAAAPGLTAAAAGVADWLLAAAKEREKAAYEARSRLCSWHLLCSSTLPRADSARLPRALVHHITRACAGDAGCHRGRAGAGRACGTWRGACTGGRLG